MSYKKFTRGHGRTARVSKYKWSTPDKTKKLRSKYKRLSTKARKHGGAKTEVRWLCCGRRLVRVEVWSCGKVTIQMIDEQ